MSDEITIDKTVFHDRLSSFLNQWRNDKRAGDVLFGGSDSIVLLVGKASEAGTYNKTTAFQVERGLAYYDTCANVVVQLWLLGYEFPSTLFILTLAGVHVVTTKKKGTLPRDIIKEHMLISALWLSGFLGRS